MQMSFFVSFVIVTVSLMVPTIILFHFSALLPHLSFSFEWKCAVHVHQENVFEDEIMNKEY